MDPTFCATWFVRGNVAGNDGTSGAYNNTDGRLLFLSYYTCLARNVKRDNIGQLRYVI